MEQTNNPVPAVNPAINPNADHILLWRDENGWHCENYGSENMIPVYGDFPDAIAEGQAFANEPCMENKRVFLVQISFVHQFQPKR